MWPGCDFMIPDENGKPSCSVHNRTDKGCHLFPWHPFQLVNIERDDLPRIPMYRSPKTLYYGLPPDVKDAVFVGWAALGEVCKYAFIDVTDELTPNRRKRVKPAEDPRVKYQNPSWFKKEAS